MLWPISRAALALLAHSIQIDYTYLLVISNRPILLLLFLETGNESVNIFFARIFVEH